MSTVIDNLCQALEKLREEELPPVRTKIHNILESIVDEEKTNSDFSLDSIASRIKSIKSFKEKIPRKRYVDKWELTESSNVEDCVIAIRKNLEDLIGFRINCYFKDEEGKAYKAILDALEKKKISIRDKGLQENGEIKKQKSGKPIYKIVCEIKNKGKSYLFEVQIKSLVHTLWGEVEHEIAYKAKQYTYNYRTRNKILEQNLEALSTCDRQLLCFLSEEYTDVQLANSLFFYYTKEFVMKKMNGENPIQYYPSFFRLTKSKPQIIKDFVSNCLKQSDTPTFSQHQYKKPSPRPILKYFVNEVIAKYNDKSLWDDVKKISSAIYKFRSDDFIWFMGDCLLPVATKTSSPIDTDGEVDVGDTPSDVEINLKKDVPSEPKTSLKKDAESFREHLMWNINHNHSFSSEEKVALSLGLENFYDVFYKEY